MKIKFRKIDYAFQPLELFCQKDDMILPTIDTNIYIRNDDDKLDLYKIENISLVMDKKETFYIVDCKKI